MIKDHPFPITDFKEALVHQSSVLAKIAENRVRGLEELADLSSGVRTPYSRPGEDIARAVMAVRLEFDEVAQRRFVRRIVQPMEEIARNLGVPAIFSQVYPGAKSSNRDLSPHVTLAMGKLVDLEMYSGNLPTSRDFGYLNDFLESVLVGIPVVFDTLVIGANSYVCDSNPDHRFYRVRGTINALLGEEGYSAQDSSNLLHAVTGRSTWVAPLPMLHRFAERSYKKVGESLEIEPLELKPAKVRAMTMHEFAVLNGLAS